MDGYVCDLCGYEYVQDAGDIENGVKPMTPCLILLIIQAPMLRRALMSCHLM